MLADTSRMSSLASSNGSMLSAPGKADMSSFVSLEKEAGETQVEMTTRVRAVVCTVQVAR